MAVVNVACADNDNSEFEEMKTALVSQQFFEDHAQWNKLIRKLERKHSGEIEYFLDLLFYKTHQVLLKNYSKHSDFMGMMKNGNYDCVSGSQVYSLLLTHFNIDHTIIETDYHVFVVARVEGKEYILESTDPLNGFIKNEEAVIQYIAKFKPRHLSKSIQNSVEIGAENYSTNIENTMFKKINFKQLSGLQFYNHSINAINKKDFGLARKEINKAMELYPSNRIKSVSLLINELDQSSN